MADATTLLSVCDPVQLVLIKTDLSGETTLVASHFLEWRSVLGVDRGVTTIAVELQGVGEIIVLFINSLLGTLLPNVEHIVNVYMPFTCCNTMNW